MTRRRTLALALALLVTAVGLSSGTPASAAEQPVLLGAVVSTDEVVVPAIFTTSFRFAGDVSGVSAEWTHGSGANQQTVMSDQWSVNPGLSVYPIEMKQGSWMQAGTWTLSRVTLYGADSVTPVVYGGAGRPLPAPAASFDKLTGPASLVDLGAATGTVTDANTTTPSGASKSIATSGSLLTSVTYSGATPSSSMVQPVYVQVGTGRALAIAADPVPSASGTAVVGTTADSSHYTDGDWALTRVLVTNGVAFRSVSAAGSVTYVQSRTDRFGQGASCTGYLGDYTGVTLDPGCVLVASTSAVTGGLGDAANVVTMSGMAVQDGAAPALTDAAISSHTVVAGGTVTVTAHYTDTQALPRANQQLYVELRQGSHVLSTGTPSEASCVGGGGSPASCTVSLPVTVPTDAFPGAYVADLILTRDGNGNYVRYSPTTYTTDIGGHVTTSSTMPPGSPNLSGLGLTVTGGLGTDSTAPTLSSFVRTSPTQLDFSDPTLVTDAAVFHWSGADVGLGIAEVRVSLISPSTHQYSGGSWTPTFPAVSGTSGDVTVSPSSIVVGDWVVRSVRVTDRRGNVRYYDADGAVTPGGTRHSFDFATAGFSLVGGLAAAVPTAPRALTASGRDQKLVVSWLPPASAGGSALTSYDVSLTTDELTPPITVHVVGSTTTTFASLTNESAYSVSVVASNAAGPGPIAWIPGTWVHKVAPLVAAGIGAVAPILRATKVAFTGTVPAVQAGAPVTGYRTQVRRAVAGVRLPSAWTSYGAVRPAPAGSVTGIRPGERVCVRVVAVNAVGVGAGSPARCTVALADDRSLATATKGWSRVALAGAYLKTVTTSRTVGARLLSGAAYGTAITLAARTIPGGGTVGIYVGTKLVATWSLASTKSAFVTKTVVTALAGQHVTVKVLKAGKAGVVIDGWAVRP